MFDVRGVAGSVVVLACALVIFGPVAAAAQPQIETLSVKAFRLAHQPAREALRLVEPMLSPAGSVELRLADNTLVLTDQPTVISRIEFLLREFDHTPLDLQLAIHLLRVTQGPPDSAHQNLLALPPGLVESLGAMASRNRYELLGAIELASKEGAEVSYEVAEKYEVRFTVGTVLLEQRLRLRSFEVLQWLGDIKSSLLQAHLNLWLGKTLVVSVADRGLAVAVTCAIATKPPAERPAAGVGEP